MAKETIPANELYAYQHNASLSVDAPSRGVSVLADGDRLEQVVTNFISNAVKHSERGETVHTVVRQFNDQIRVEVHDNGAGIPPEFRDKVFLRFARADSSAARRSSGSGLGLFICRSIIEQHGGRIGFESAPGEGTTFYFELPALVQALSA